LPNSTIAKKVDPMKPNILTLAALTAALAACATAPAPAPRLLMTAPAPTSFDGNVAGQAGDQVFVLVADANPATPGVSLAAGDTLRIELPAAFRRNTAVAIAPDADTNLVLTKGWPQGSVRLAGQYRIGYDEKAHAMTVTALQDVAISGANAPGVKVVHLRGRTFVNPVPGPYPVTVSQVADDGRVKVRWQGRLEVMESAPDARLAPTNFHLPPGTNADFQKLGPAQVAPLELGVLLWGPQGAPMNGVGIAPRDLTRFPKYTGGLLVQDMNGDRQLDPAVDKVVGGIVGAAPQGATGQAATSPLGADGAPVLSGAVLRDAGFPAATQGGKPNPGLLAIQFKAGDKPGLYQPTIELIGGNSYRYTVEVVGL
jgi:hypothetical protein